MKNAITKILLLVMIMSVSVFFIGCNKSDKTANQNNSEVDIPSNSNTEEGSESSDAEVSDEEIRELTGYEELEGFKEYVNSYHACTLEGILYPTGSLKDLNSISRDSSINKHPIYLKIDSLKKGEYLNFSIVYKDDNGKENAWVNFKSDSVELEEQDGYPNLFYYSYSGCLTNPNNKDYKYCTGNKQACSTDLSDENYHKDCVKKSKGGITIIEPSKRSVFVREFSMKDTFFNSEKEETIGSSLPVYLYPRYLLTIKHEGVLEIP